MSHEGFFGFFESLFQSVFWVLREGGLIGDDVVKIVAKKLRASVTAMPVEYGEERRLFDSRGQRLVGFGARLLEIKHDRDPIFIVVTGSAVVSVGGIRQDVALGLARDLRRLNFGNDLPKWSNAMISDRGCSDAEGVAAVDGGLLLVQLLGCLSFVLDAVQQALQSLRPDKTLHSGHVVHVVEVAQVLGDRGHLRVLLRHLPHAVARAVRLLELLVLIVEGAHLAVDHHACRILVLIVDPTEAEVLGLLELAAGGRVLVLHHLNGRLVNLGVFYPLVDRPGLPLVLVHLVGTHLRLVSDLTALGLVAVDTPVHVLHGGSWTMMRLGTLRRTAVGGSTLALHAVLLDLLTRGVMGLVSTEALLTLVSEVH